MSRFQLENDINLALRLDTSLTIASRKHGRTLPKSRGSGSNSSLSSSQLLSATGQLLGSNNPNISGRSRSTSRLLSPSRLLIAPGSQGTHSASLNTSRSPSRSRPNKAGGSGNDSRSRTPSRGRTGTVGDRFIPNRSTCDMDAAHHSIVNSNNNTFSNTENNSNGANVDQSSSENLTAEQQRREKLKGFLNADILTSSEANSVAATQDRILSFRNKAPAADEAHLNNHKVLYSTGKPKAPLASKTRQIPSKPEKILDAPDLLDDFYLHQLDWSCNNHLAVSLFDALYIWNAADGSIVELFSKSSQNEEGSEDYISSVSWIKEGNILAVGDSQAEIQLWDVTSSKLMRRMGGHTDRIVTLDWNEHILASGSRSGAIHLHDVRQRDHHVGTLRGHTQEVCGMQWSPDSGRLLATGGNDNQVMVWDGRSPDSPVHTLSAHQAAVKAISWCPWQPKTLASGGGTNDREIRFWNTATGACINSVDTGSQICGILWNEEYKELVTGHGFSHNQLTVWKYPAMTKVVDLKGHTQRVLLLMKSPDGSTIASAAGDETIRMWKIWPHKDKKVESRKKTKEPVSLFSQQRSIR